MDTIVVIRGKGYDQSMLSSYLNQTQLLFYSVTIYIYIIDIHTVETLLKHLKILNKLQFPERSSFLSLIMATNQLNPSIYADEGASNAQLLTPVLLYSMLLPHIMLYQLEV